MIDISRYFSDERLDDLFASYDVTAIEGLEKVTSRLWERIENYETHGSKPYGRAQLAPHLKRISEDLYSFLLYLGLSELQANNARQAYYFSDLGKTHPAYNDIDWMADERPSDEEKTARREHTWRGVDIWQDAFQNEPSLKSHPHVAQAAPALMLFHHEKANGEGQFGKYINEMGLILQAACLVDAFDGDRIHRAHQEDRRSVSETLERLTGVNESKYMGAFDNKMLEAYTHYHATRKSADK